MINIIKAKTIKNAYRGIDTKNACVPFDHIKLQINNSIVDALKCRQNYTIVSIPNKNLKEVITLLKKGGYHLEVYSHSYNPSLTSTRIRLMW